MKKDKIQKGFQSENDNDWVSAENLSLDKEDI
jgi:hypothetical protein